MLVLTYTMGVIQLFITAVLRLQIFQQWHLAVNQQMEDF